MAIRPAVRVQDSPPGNRRIALGWRNERHSIGPRTFLVLRTGHAQWGALRRPHVYSVVAKVDFGRDLVGRALVAD